MLQHYTTLSPRRVNVQDTTCQDSVLEIVHCVWMSFVPFISIEFREAAHVCEPHIPKQQAPMTKGQWENFLKNVEPSVRPGASVRSPGTTVTELTQDLHQSWAPMLVCKSQRSSPFVSEENRPKKTAIWKRVWVLSLSRLSVLTAQALKQRRTCGHKRLLFFKFMVTERRVISLAYQGSTY